MTTGSASTRAALKTTKTVPIVFGSAGNPVEQGFVASLARPGGNVTGFALYLDEVAPKRLQLLKEMLPGASRIARFHAVGNVGGQTAVRRRYDEAASALGITLQHFALSRAEVAAAFARARADRVHAVIIEADPIFMADPETKEKDRGRVARLALEHRMPVMSADVRYVEDGCLIGYSEDLPAQYGRAATYVDRILKGTRPEDLPVQQGSVQLVVNAATARALGLKIPHSIRVQANVIRE
jgi:putative ABC transport system substrate-binding protein